MPTVLRELLASRKATRKLIKFKTVTLKNGESYSGLLNKGEEEYTLNYLVALDCVYVLFCRTCSNYHIT